MPSSFESSPQTGHESSPERSEKLNQMRTEDKGLFTKYGGHPSTAPGIGFIEGCNGHLEEEGLH